MEFFFVVDDFDGYENVSFMVDILYYLIEIFFFEYVYDFIVICKMVIGYDVVVIVFIVVVEIGIFWLNIIYNFCCVLCVVKVDVFIVYNFFLFVDIENCNFDGFLRVDVFFGWGMFVESI